MPFVCYEHDGERLEWFIPPLGQFFCEMCVQDLQIDKKNCEACTDLTISDHAHYIVEKMSDLIE